MQDVRKTQTTSRDGDYKAWDKKYISGITSRLEYRRRD